MSQPVTNLERRLQGALERAATQVAAHPSEWKDRAPATGRTAKPRLPGAGTVAAYALIAVTVGIAVGGMLLLGHAQLRGSPSPRPTVAANPRPKFVSESALVRRVHHLRGTPIVIFAWASWCKPCQPDLTRVLQAATRYHQARFLLADIDDSRGRARRILVRYRVGGPVYQTEVTLRGILKQPLVGLPTLIFIGPRGNVAYIHSGEYGSLRALDHNLAVHLPKS
jgi:thiol-disulfide isomerase/thioredoxin